MLVEKYLQLTKSDSIEGLNEVRDSYIQARIKISGFVNTWIREDKNTDFIELLNCMQSFFFQPGNGMRSEGADYIDEIISASKHERTDIRDLFKERQLKYWRYSVEEYSTLKIKYKSRYKIG